MPVKELFDLINKANDTYLNYNNFLIEEPIEVIDGEDYNTTVRIRTKDSNRKRGDIILTYKREDIDDIFRANDEVEFLLDDETSLYEYLPVINEKLDINLTEEDVFDVVLDPTIPDTVKVPVPITIKQNSYMYYGDTTLYLGKNTVSPNIVNNTLKRILVVNDSLPAVDTIRSIDLTAIPVDPFIFLANCDNIIDKTIEECFISNNRIVLIGDFTLDAYLGQVVEQLVNVGTIYLDHTGRLVDYKQEKLNDNGTLIRNEKFDFLYKYTINGTNTDIIKLTYRGNQFPTWNVTVPFIVSKGFTDSEGNLYLVSEKYNNGSDTVLDIYKYLSDGSIDPNWTIVQISSSVYTTDTHGIYGISITDNYVDLYIEPQINVSTNDSLPVVNGIPYIVPKSTALPDFGWLPIIRLNKITGEVINNFDPVSETENFKSLWLDPPTAFNIPNPIISNDKEISIISYSDIHPGGWENYRLLPVNNRGYISHEWWNKKREMPVWSEIKDVYHTEDGYTFITGIGKLNQGGVMTPDLAIVTGFNRKEYASLHILETLPLLVGNQILVLEF